MLNFQNESPRLSFPYYMFTLSSFLKGLIDLYPQKLTKCELLSFVTRLMRSSSLRYVKDSSLWE
jgi:hypothetical protein